MRVENALENAFEHDYLNSMNTTIKTVLTRLQNIMNTTTKTLWTRLQKQYEHGYKKQYEHDCKNSLNTTTKTAWTWLQKQLEHGYINCLNRLQNLVSSCIRLICNIYIETQKLWNRKTTFKQMYVFLMLLLRKWFYLQW